uniref:Uncharacterized protein n=2 Tax=Ixodes scapularis TaxID=6945 RepID=A0A1S4L1A4_IXOSC
STSNTRRSSTRWERPTPGTAEDEIGSRRQKADSPKHSKQRRTPCRRAGPSSRNPQNEGLPARGAKIISGPRGRNEPAFHPSRATLPTNKKQRGGGAWPKAPFA